MHLGGALPADGGRGEEDGRGQEEIRTAANGEPGLLFHTGKEIFYKSKVKKICGKSRLEFLKDEYGVQLIRDLLARFAASQQYKREETEEEREGRRAQGEEERCGCKMPCVQNILELAGVSDERDGDFSDFAFAYFQVRLAKSISNS